ncbi:MAG: TDP-N-acetylfucosamine:lipid II N-acetylfucosaminyltransferase [Bacteroidetes bacterium]|nr:TDP-N-acetylfucosamine:lipid II N-acetylfucosaminyltransferase [Bacteroidota bacterium]
MNIHLALDDKFIDYFIRRQRKNFPSTDNRYIICSHQFPYKHVKSSGVELCSFNEDELKFILNNNKVNRVYIHFFTSFFYKVISELSPRVKVYWMFWGGDGFGFPDIYPKFLDKYSLAFYKENFYEGKSHKILNRGFRLKSTWEKFNDFKKKRKAALDAFRRVDFFCHYLPSDYKLLRRTFRMKAQLIDFCYCSYEDLCFSETTQINSNNIFIGNSANEANNHISLLKTIKKSNLVFDKIYCPLSYAGHPAYIEMVINNGRHLFGDKFYPILEFLTLNAYNTIINSCGKFFHNHYRSQAYGNIVYQVHIGKEVYLNAKSPLKSFLRKNHIHLGTIDNNGIHCGGNESENRRHLQNLLSEDEINKKYSKVFN